MHMKKITFILFIAGAILSGAVGCASREEPVPEWGCWVFVTTTENPVLLLAKSGPSAQEAIAIEANFKSQYGKENIDAGYGVPRRRDSDGNYIPINDPTTKPNCYEITMTLSFPDTPPINGLFSFGFQAVKTNENTAICKWYDWALTEDDAEYLIPRLENWYKYSRDGGGGTIMGTTTIKKLGTEVHNMPIIF
jgi:hypothetical protein